MKYIISGTNRRGSRTLQISQLIKKIYDDLGEPVQIIDLSDIDLHELDGTHYGTLGPGRVGVINQKIIESDGIIIVVPEYNGSVPGALKYFIDHWKYPESFEQRAFCFVGLGGMFGGLRPVEHLQQIVGYRNGFVFPIRVFLQNIWNNLKNGQLEDNLAKELLIKQAKDFTKFCHALKGAGLDATTVNRERTAIAPLKTAPKD